MRCAILRGFVIGGDRDNFSVGANLLQLLLGSAGGRMGRSRTRQFAAFSR